MCGIIGVINFKDSISIVKNGLRIMKNRGVDSTNFLKYKNIVFGHNLHAIIDFVKQPLVSKKGILVFNGEIYNWKELSKKYNFIVKNDSELILKLIDYFGLKNINKVLNEIEGVFAFAYFSKKEKKLVICRDIIGVVPLIYYFDSKKFAFASEKKAFDFETKHLNPRKILFLKFLKSNKLKISFKDRIIKKSNKKNSISQLKQTLVKSVEKRIPDKKFALLLSGGIDSYLLGQLLKSYKLKSNELKNKNKTKNKKINENANFISYFAHIKGFNEPKDLEFAKIAAKNLKSKLKIISISLNKFEKELPKIIALIESSDPVRVGVASTIYFATKNIKEKVVFLGLGADELFAGYSRFKNSKNINADCYSYLIKLYENDLYYQNIVCMNNKTELRLPYLDTNFVKFALSLDSKFKINSKKNKIFLRDFSKEMSGEKLIFNRNKKAAQYGSNFDKALEVLAKKNGFKSKADYLKNIGEKIKYKKPKNINLCGLLSTGKDSIYAINLMQKQGYKIKCLITIASKNKDSFMFHTPTIKLSNSIADSIKIPLIVVKTIGEKESELIDLKKAISLAIKKYSVEGVVNGALYSNYQRQRIEKICENLGVRSFSPLWHMNQAKYLEKLIKEGFVFIITKIACYGLDESWLGRKIDEKSIKELIKLEKKYGINVAGEGGEYETLIVDAPIFNKKLEINFDKKMENEFTGEIIIKKFKLIKK